MSPSDPSFVPTPANQLLLGKMKCIEYMNQKLREEIDELQRAKFPYTGYLAPAIKCMESKAEERRDDGDFDGQDDWLRVADGLRELQRQLERGQDLARKKGKANDES